SGPRSRALRRARGTNCASARRRRCRPGGPLPRRRSRRTCSSSGSPLGTPGRLRCGRRTCWTWWWRCSCGGSIRGGGIGGDAFEGGVGEAATGEGGQDVEGGDVGDLQRGAGENDQVGELARAQGALLGDGAGGGGGPAGVGAQRLLGREALPGGSVVVHSAEDVPGLG